MKKFKTLILVAFISSFLACDKMEDNYKQYLEEEVIYSPKVFNLTKTVGLRTVTLTWDNPPGNIAKKILVDYQDDSIVYETMIDSTTLMDLEIKNYVISVYTIDEYGNYSVPETVSAFPNGEGQK